MTTKFDNMGKTELRAACKAAGVKYGTLNNDGMRAALIALEPKAPEAKPAKELEKGPRDHSVGYSGKGLRIEKNREANNGVKRPSVGGTCRAVWDALDEKRAALLAAADAMDESEEGGDEDTTTVPSFADLKVMIAKNGWARNTAMTQYQRWKQFNSLMARSQAE